jgi:hypothetical protein
MKVSRSSLKLLAAFSIGLISLSSFPVRAVQLSDGTVSFVQPPRLDRASSTQKSAHFPGSTYFFTLTLPDNAGEPLQKVVITQEPSSDVVRFDRRYTEAFEGTADREGAKLPLKEVVFDRQARTVTVLFEPPVAPGKTVTIGLYAIRNPDVGGVYLYGVTAFPAGEKARGQFLGYGRIHIYDNWDSFFRRW